MSEHLAHIAWRRTTEDFRYETYSRSHEWRFDNGVVIEAAAAPAWLGDGTRIDPEEAFVASIASCHMLTFLAIAARKRLVVDAYEDRAVGFLRENARGRLAVTRVELFPRIEFAAGGAPLREALEKMHHLAHETCFIANSVTTEIVIHIEAPDSIEAPVSGE